MNLFFHLYIKKIWIQSIISKENIAFDLRSAVSLKKNKISTFFVYIFVTTIKFKITYVASITILLDSAVLY